MKVLDYIGLMLVIVGAVNWGLIGFFSFDLVRFIFGDMEEYVAWQGAEREVRLSA